MTSDQSPNVVRVRDRTFSPFIADVEIRTMVNTMAQQINHDYAGREILLLVILKGAMVFASDLMRELTIPLTVDTLRASSYRDAMRSSGSIDVEDIMPDVADKHVLIVEDIIDSGNTIKELIKRLGSYQPASIGIASLLSKPDVHGRELQIDYVGREIGREFVVGYGLDYAGYGRHLDAIWVVNPVTDDESDT